MDGDDSIIAAEPLCGCGGHAFNGKYLRVTCEPEGFTLRRPSFGEVMSKAVPATRRRRKER
jgi:hypothetical protein